MYKYVLFDLDGTLTDPKLGICRSVQHALEKSGLEVPGIDELTPFIGPPLKDSFRQFCGMNDEEAEQAVSYYRERFSEIGWKENEVYEGIPEMLEAAHAAGVRLAIASSKPTVFVERILKHFKLRRYFDVVVGSELDGTRSKKEEVVAEALKQLYTRFGKKEDERRCREATAMVGDRRFDIEGARSEGVDAIGVSYGYQEEGELAAAGADAIATDVAELRELLLGGEDAELRELRRKREEKERKLKVLPVPDRSFFRALYMIIPFAVYFLLHQGILYLEAGLLDLGKQKAPEWMSAHSAGLSLLAGALARGVTIILLYLIYRRREALHVLPLWRKKEVPRKLALIIVAGISLSAILNVVLTGLAERIVPMIYGDEAAKKILERAAYDKSVPLLAGILLYVILAPLLEELVFRGLLLARMRRVFSAKLCIVLTALFFGFYHGNILQGVYAFLMGLFLGHLAVKEDGLLAPLLFHMTANAFIFLASYFLPELA
ncbi:MAG: HAD hydrolase-like protein [Lachnospiraceae bacterium]|nr:HAD hydrolase-like protein [Lachnospiraceae bacterium]